MTDKNKPIETILVQSLTVEGGGGLLEGGCTYTMTARDLINVLARYYKIPKDQPIKVIGVGATESLGDEITYMGENLYVISGDTGKIETKRLALDTKISFSQIGLQAIDGVSQQLQFPIIKAPRSDRNAHEINRGGVFKELLKAIGDETSAVVEITANTQYIKSRAPCNIVKETGKRLSPAAGLKTMILGGTVKDKQGNTLTVPGQTVWEQSFDRPESIKMVGIITGKNLAENKILEGLHLHCKYGHILDLGELTEVKVQVTPVSKTFILLPERTKDGKFIWHTALQNEHLESLKYTQKLFRAYLHRKERPGAFTAVVQEIDQKEQDGDQNFEITAWAKYLSR